MRERGLRRGFESRVSPTPQCELLFRICSVVISQACPQCELLFQICFVTISSVSCNLRNSFRNVLMG